MTPQANKIINEPAKKDLKSPSTHPLPSQYSLVENTGIYYRNEPSSNPTGSQSFLPSRIGDLTSFKYNMQRTKHTPTYNITIIL